MKMVVSIVFMLFLAAVVDVNAGTKPIASNEVITSKPSTSPPVTSLIRDEVGEQDYIGIVGGTATNPISYDFGSLLAGAYATFTVDPSFTGTVYAHASLTYHDGSLSNAQAQHAANIAQTQAVLNSAAAAATTQAHTNAAGLTGGYLPGGFPVYQGYPFPTFAFPTGVPQIPASAIGIPAPSRGHAASASAAIGGGGSQQTAYLSPENPSSPNVNVVNRFQSSPVPADGGSFGVFTSSSSVSQNVDGKETVHRQATTTVNDNGKVTTYTVKDP